MQGTCLRSANLGSSDPLSAWRQHSFNYRSRERLAKLPVVRVPKDSWGLAHNPSPPLLALESPTCQTSNLSWYRTRLSKQMFPSTQRHSPSVIPLDSVQGDFAEVLAIKAQRKNTSGARTTTDFRRKKCVCCEFVYGNRDTQESVFQTVQSGPAKGHGAKSISSSNQPALHTRDVQAS